MRADLARAARLLTLPTLALGGVIAFAPGRVELGLRIYVFVLAAAVLAVTLAALRRAYPRPWRRPARPAAAPSPRPATLTRIEHELALGVASSFDLHHRLRPRVRRLASELLAARRGIALDRDPGRARAALGEPCFELVRPGRPAPEDRLARGIAIPELRAVVESLEKL